MSKSALVYRIYRMPKGSPVNCSPVNCRWQRLAVVESSVELHLGTGTQISATEEDEPYRASLTASVSIHSFTHLSP